MLYSEIEPFHTYSSSVLWYKHMIQVYTPMFVLYSFTTAGTRTSRYFSTVADYLFTEASKFFHTEADTTGTGLLSYHFTTVMLFLVSVLISQLPLPFFSSCASLFELQPENLLLLAIPVPYIPIFLVHWVIYRVFVRKWLFWYWILVTRKYLNTKKIISFRIYNSGLSGISTVFWWN